MKRNTLTILIAMTTAIVLVVPALAFTKQELQARFERRYPQLRQYKTDGKIGETTAGLVEAVDPKFLEDQALSSLINEENSDRRELYGIIAQEEQTSPQVVAQRMARRNYERARPGDFLKTADGQWKQKT